MDTRVLDGWSGNMCIFDVVDRPANGNMTVCVECLFIYIL